MTQPSGDASGERAAHSPAGAAGGGDSGPSQAAAGSAAGGASGWSTGARPRAESTEPELDPNDPYRYGRPDPDPALLRFGPQSPGLTPPGSTPPGSTPPGSTPPGSTPPGSAFGPRSPFGPPSAGADPWSGPYQGQAPPQQPWPGQYPGQAPYPPQYSQYPQPRNRNGLAIAGLVLGLVGLFLFWLPVVGAIIGVLGIVFGLIGLRAARAGGGTGRGLALAGVICGAVATVLCIVWSVYFFTKVNQCAQYGVGSSSYNQCLQQR